MNEISTSSIAPYPRWLLAILALSALASLLALSQYNFLLFHVLSELFAIAVAWSVFLLVWNTRRIARNDALVSLGIAYFFIGIMDLVHTMAYKGMGVFPEALSANYATQAWIAARSMEALSLLLYALGFGKRHRLHAVLVAYATATGLLILSIFGLQNFPLCWMEVSGLTSFKILAEYAICLVIGGALLVLSSKRHRLNPAIFRLLAASMILTIVSELMFTLYTDVYGMTNVAGHFLKIISFFLIYQALIRSSLTDPYNRLYRQLSVEHQALINREFEYKALFQQMLDGFALHEIICDDQGRPVDYRFLAMNPAFEKLTGLKAGDLIGQRVTTILPGTEQYWIDTYGKVAQGGAPVHFNNYSAILNKHFEVTAFCPSPGRFACIFADISEQKEAVERLRQALNEKEILVREVHHRVKNNLNVISSLLNLQSATIQTPEQALVAFQNSRDRILAMALVHEELYRSKDFSRIAMKDYLERLTGSLKSIYTYRDTIKLKLEAEDILLDVNTAVPCGLIMNELITNAYKYAFPDGRAGEIFISMGPTTDGLQEIVISDNGVGMPEGLEAGSSLGLTLVRLLVDQIAGKLQVQSTNGTRWQIVFPV